VEFFSSDPSSDMTKVSIPGTRLRLRINVTPEKVRMLAIESSRAREIVTFDPEPTVTPDFRPYLVGDRVDVRGAIRLRIKRGKPEIPATVAPVPSAGCSKDTDCKGDRICSNGMCVSPR